MTLADFNQLDPKDAFEALQKCCGSTTWVNLMIKHHPFENKESLFEIAEKNWFHSCTEKDWLEAFTHHPKIGDIKSLEKKFASTKAWAGNEQAGVNVAHPETLQALAKGNQDYEDKFAYIFIVCATGKSAAKMLTLLEKRIDNHPKKEIKIAMREQEKITQLRLKKLLTEE